MDHFFVKTITETLGAKGAVTRRSTPRGYEDGGRIELFLFNRSLTHVLIMCALLTVCLLLLGPECGAQKLMPLPADLAQVPNLGIEKSKATRGLDKLVQFSEKKENNGFVNITGATASGLVRVNFKCAGELVVAGSVAVPPTSRDPAEMKNQAIKTAVVLQFMTNLVPGHDWSNPDKNSLAEAIGQISRNPEKTWATIIGDKFIFAKRDQRPGLISVGVIPTKFRETPYDIGGF